MSIVALGAVYHSHFDLFQSVVSFLAVGNFSLEEPDLDSLLTVP